MELARMEYVSVTNIGSYRIVHSARANTIARAMATA